jgi:hypothetical protein
MCGMLNVKDMKSASHQLKGFQKGAETQHTTIMITFYAYASINLMYPKPTLISFQQIFFAHKNYL